MKQTDEQKQVVKQEAGFARDQRFQFVLALQVRQISNQEENADGGGQSR